MRNPPDIAGDDLVACLCRHWDYHFIKQVGRHVRLETFNPRFQRVTVPVQARIKGGLASVILKSVAAHKRVDVQNIIETL